MLLVPYASCYNHFVAIQEVEFSLKNDIWIASSPRTPIHVKQALLLIQLFPTFNFGKLTWLRVKKVIKSWGLSHDLAGSIPLVEDVYLAY